MWALDWGILGLSNDANDNRPSGHNHQTDDMETLTITTTAATDMLTGKVAPAHPPVQVQVQTGTARQMRTEAMMRYPYALSGQEVTITRADGSILYP